jgi:protein-S-isoprenylcysteine O-methyltransferase Ste14
MLRSAVRFLALLLFVPALLFAAAGTLAWPLAWAYVVLATAASLGSRLILARKHPDTLQERAKGFKAEGTQAWDRWLVPPVIWGAIVTLIVAALDHRFGWSWIASTPLRVGALVGAALGYGLAAWAMAENRFFYATVRLQRDRGHTVVSSGPYRLVRHPAYAGSLLATLLVPVMLGSLWAFVPAVLTAVAVVVRTGLEDRFLRRELEGYAAYAARTRWRLVWGVW